MPVPQVDRVGITLALISGGIVCWVLWGSDVGARAKRLVPQVAIVDAMPVAAAGFAAWLTWPILVARNGVGMLNLLMKSLWDHSSHFAMALQIRTHGAIVPMLGSAPDGTDWQWALYPQHYHAANAALTELYSGPAVGDAASEVLLYGRSVALIHILIAVLLAAGVAQLPSLRRRPFFAWPMAAMVVGAFVLGTGSRALSYGQPNFIVACAASGLAVMLAAQISGALRPLHIFALGGLVVATVHSWTLLGPVAAVGAAAAFLPLGRVRYPQTRGAWAKMTIAAVVVVAASLAVIPVLRTAGGLGFLNIAYHWPFDAYLEKTSLVLLTGCTAVAFALTAYVRNQSRESATKGLALTATAAAAALTLLAVAAYYLATAGALGHYFNKLEDGIPLVALVILAASVGLHIGTSPPARGRGRTVVAIIVTIVAVVGALQIQGIEGWRYHNKAERLAPQPTAEAQRLLDAAALAETRPFGSTFYIAAMPDDLGGEVKENQGGHTQVMASAERWFCALSVSYTSFEEHVYSHLHELGSGTEALSLDDAAAVTLSLLTEDPERTAIVAPQVVNALRDLLPEEFRSRVITWDEG